MFRVAERLAELTLTARCRVVDASIPPSCESDTAGQDERDSEAGRGADSRVSPAESPVVDPDDDGLGLPPSLGLGRGPAGKRDRTQQDKRHGSAREADGPIQSSRARPDVASMHLTGMEMGPKPW